MKVPTVKATARVLCALTLGLAATAATAAPSRDWPTWSGPNRDLTTAGDGVFSGPSFGLETAWTRDLGSGYSRIVVVGDRVIAAFSDGESDLVAALDAENGKEIWRYRIAETYEGHDGSDDGPIGTPTVAGGKVFGLGPRGHLFAVRLADGEEIWARRLGEDLARKPVYGFATTPTVIGGVLVVETGGAEGRAVSGFDPADGRLLWSVADASVGYQSPMALEIGGAPQVFAVTNQHLLGLAPETGEVLWKLQYKEDSEEGFAQPIPVRGDQVLVTDWNEAALYQVRPEGDGFAVTETWRSRALRGTYTIPAPYEGHLYGYSGRFLTCVDAATGETVWKSRPPGNGNLVLVDGHLVIQAESGDVVVAAATPEGYREKARAKVLERGYLTAPSFAGGRLYVRNLSRIASVAVTERAAGAAAPAPARPEVEPRGVIADLARRAAAADDKGRVIDEFLAARESFPIIEGDRLVHFVYRGEVADLAVTGNFIHNRDEVMGRIDGTDFYYRSYELAPASHYAYAFRIFDETVLDPRNPRTVQDLPGERSVVTTPPWSAPKHLTEPTGERGKIEKRTWKSEILGDEREVEVYLPPGYGEGERRYPVLMVNYGDQMLAAGRMAHSLDNLVGESVEPLIAVFVPRNRYEEYAGSLVGDYTRALTGELLAEIDAAYRTRRESSARAVMGVASGAAQAVYAAVSRPDVFGAAAVQAYYFGDTRDAVEAGLAENGGDLTVYVAISRFDYVSGPVDAAKESRELVALLERHGHRPVVDEVGDGFGWAGWSLRTGRILETLFPRSD